MDDTTRTLLIKLAQTVLDVLQAPARAPAPPPPVAPVAATIDAIDAAVGLAMVNVGDPVRVWDGDRWRVATVANIGKRGKNKGKLDLRIERPGNARSRRLQVTADRVFPLNNGGEA